jgi:hypothetical protein
VAKIRGQNSHDFGSQVSEPDLSSKSQRRASRALVLDSALWWLSVEGRPSMHLDSRQLQGRAGQGRAGLGLAGASLIQSGICPSH